MYVELERNTARGKERERETGRMRCTRGYTEKRPKEDPTESERKKF